jgi:hypothetical protein
MADERMTGRQEKTAGEQRAVVTDVRVTVNERDQQSGGQNARRGQGETKE